MTANGTIRDVINFLSGKPALGEYSNKAIANLLEVVQNRNEYLECENSRLVREVTDLDMKVRDYETNPRA